VSIITLEPFRHNLRRGQGREEPGGYGLINERIMWVRTHDLREQGWVVMVCCYSRSIYVAVFY